MLEAFKVIIRREVEGGEVTSQEGRGAIFMVELTP